MFVRLQLGHTSSSRHRLDLEKRLHQQHCTIHVAMYAGLAASETPCKTSPMPEPGFVSEAVLFVNACFEP